MTERRRPHRRALEWCKNVLIVLLLLSALALAGRSGMAHELSDSASDSWLGRLAALLHIGSDPAPAQTLWDGPPAMAAQAVRIAICNNGERFAAQYDDAQTARIFDAVSSLLGEGLASAKAAVEVDQSAWRSALQMPGVYFDFLGSIPLDALYAWLGEGGSNPNLSAAARQVLLALDSGGTVSLYYRNEETGLYYACRTSVAYHGHMADLLADYGDNGAMFAFEFGAGHAYSALAPDVLILPAAPAPKVYSSANPLSAMDSDLLETLQHDLSFTPQGSSEVYSVQGGGVTIREGRETLTLGGDGTAIYHAPNPQASRYAIAGTEESATDTQLIEAARKLAAAAEAQAGSARLYLIRLTHHEDGTADVCFGYSLDGAAVCLPDGQPAAEFTIQDGQITDYTIRFRTYWETGEHSLVLQELQAAAAMSALKQDGRELVLCYEDNGSRAQAVWTAR